jgi:hypothetical protein
MAHYPLCEFKSAALLGGKSLPSLSYQKWKSECDFFTILLSFREILDIHNDHEIHHHSLPRVRPRVRHLGHGFGRQSAAAGQQTEESHQVIL